MSFLKNNNGAIVLQATGTVLTAGTHDVVVRLVKEVTDHMADLNGTPKENYPFKNVHTQIAVVLAGDKGSILRRFNTEGFVRWAELPEKQKNKYLRHPETGYAMDKKGNRIEDPKRTQECQNIFNGFVSTLQKEDGKHLIDDIAGKEIASLEDLFKMIRGCKTRVVVEERENPKAKAGEPKTNFEVVAFKRISARVAVPAGDDDDEGDGSMA